MRTRPLARLNKGMVGSSEHDVKAGEKPESYGIDKCCPDWVREREGECQRKPSGGRCRGGRSDDFAGSDHDFNRAREHEETSSSKWLHRIAVGGAGEESLPRIHDLEAPQGVELHAMIGI